MPIGFGIGYVRYLGVVLATILKWPIIDDLGRLILIYLCLVIADWVIRNSIGFRLCWIVLFDFLGDAYGLVCTC